MLTIRDYKQKVKNGEVKNKNILTETVELEMLEYYASTFKYNVYILDHFNSKAENKVLLEDLQEKEINSDMYYVRTRKNILIELKEHFERSKDVIVDYSSINSILDIIIKKYE